MRQSAWATASLTLAAMLACAALASAQSAPTQTQAQAQTQTPSAVPQWQTDAGGHLQFDVASVKQDTVDPSVQNPSSNVPMGPQNAFSPTGGLLSAKNYPLVRYMLFAYKLTNEEYSATEQQFPKWALENRYDIEARVAGNPTKDQYRLMMQALLADRFKLSVHFVDKQVPVLALVMDKPGKLGPGLHKHASDVPCGTAAEGVQTIDGGLPNRCGALVNMPSTAPDLARIGSRDVSMDLFATVIGSQQYFGMEGKPVENRTGLEGTYDLLFEFSPGSPSDETAAANASNGPSFVEALKQQLGLKLQPATGTIQTIIVDHLEEPSAN